MTSRLERTHRRQHETLCTIDDYINTKHYAPLVYEIAQILKVGTKYASYRLNELEQAGYIRRGKGLRSIEIIKRPKI